MTLPPKLEKLLENWPAKIVSLIAAILVYAFYQISSLETRIMVVPLEIEQEEGLISTSVSESSIRIAIRGNASEITALENKDIKAYADLSPYVQEGKVNVPVRLEYSDSIRMMKDVEIKPQPETVEVTLEKEMVSYIPVKINYTGGPAHGYELEQVTVSPSFIKVKGPKTLVNGLDGIDTDVVLFDELKHNVTVSTEIFALNSQLIAEHEGPVSITATVVPSRMTRKLSDVPVKIISAGQNLEIEAADVYASLIITGNELDVEKYVPSSGLIFADCSSITESGEYDIPVQYSKTSIFTIDSLLPETIHVIVTEIPVEEEITEEVEE